MVVVVALVVEGVVSSIGSSVDLVDLSVLFFTASATRNLVNT